MLLKRYAVFEDYDGVVSVYDNCYEGAIEGYDFENKEDALIKCKQLNQTCKKFNKNKISANKKQVTDIVKITIYLVDGDELSFEINKNALCLKDFITNLKHCDIDSVKCQKSIISDIMLTEA